MRRRATSVISSALAGAALVLASCGTDDPDPATPTGQETSATTESTTTVEEATVPPQVVVYQPGLIDTPLTADDVPEWPGPRPVDFMESAPVEQTPLSGVSGTLTGGEARVVYEAALDHPDALIEEGEQPNEAVDALWSLDGLVVWLVVEPEW